MKKFCIYLALLVFLLAGVYGATHMALQPPTYDGTGLNVEALFEEALAEEAKYGQPERYETREADGAASIIVEETLFNTGAVNAVTAVVFDFRGYDTMGEAFILFTAISGCLVMLRRTVKKGDGADGSGH